jgi:hypothetical protein
MPAAAGRFSSRALTGELRRMANEAVTITDDGTPVTREQLLSQLIWKQALGWDEETCDDDGNRKLIKHPPVAWCQQFLFERIEGKAQVAVTDNESGIKAADKVRELSKDRINKLAAVKMGPPSRKPKSE